jgi:hypothetical protein
LTPKLADRVQSDAGGPLPPRQFSAQTINLVEGGLCLLIEGDGGGRCVQER